MKPFVLLLAAMAVTAPVAAADGPDAAGVFKLRCGTCHGDPGIEGSVSRLGPDLHKLSGRAAASGDYARYSPGLKASGIVWNADTLDAYLLNPRATVRGTTMAFPGLRAPEERKAVVDYLLAARK